MKQKRKEEKKEKDNTKIKDILKNVPKPKTLSQKMFDKKHKDNKEEKLKESKIKYKTKNNDWKFYIIPNIIAFILISIAITLLFFRVSMLWIIVYGIFALPIILISYLITNIKLFMDRKKIAGAMTKYLSSNFVIAVFINENKTLDFQPRPINKDGISIEYDGGLYLLDKEAIFFTLVKKYSVFVYMKGLPNPLKFNFRKYLIEYRDMVNELASNVGKEQTVKLPTDWEGKVIDVAYSSENLQKLKQDKFLKEIHQDLTNKYMVLFYVMGGLIALSWIAVILIAILRGG